MFERNTRNACTVSVLCLTSVHPLAGEQFHSGNNHSGLYTSGALFEPTTMDEVNAGIVS
jgi:hypothetical protein